MKKIVVFETKQEVTQDAFEKAMNVVRDEVSEGRECDIIIRNEPNDITLVQGYIDSDVDDDGEFSAFPHFWYNKQALDELNIKYI